MTSIIWTDILTMMNGKYRRPNRHIVLFVDNTTSHQCDVPTPFIKVVYLPPNTTSLIQPCDQGIIRALKAHYRRLVNCKMLLAIEKGEDAQHFGKTICVLDVMFMLKRAMFLVSPLTGQNCFRKGKFVAHASEIDIVEEVHIEDELLLTILYLPVVI